MFSRSSNKIFAVHKEFVAIWNVEHERWYRMSPSMSLAPPHSEQHQDRKRNFKPKTPTTQLIRTALILKICSFQSLVDHGENVMKASTKVFGTNLTHKLLKNMFYQQFCIGNSTEEILEKCEVIKKSNFFPLLCVTAEEESNPSSYKFGEAWFENNKDSMLRCIDVTCASMQSSIPKPVQLKFSALFDALICKKLSVAIVHGNTAEIDNWITDFAIGNESPASLSCLSRAEQKHAIQAILRLTAICSYAAERKVSILFDGEYVDINPIINHMCCQMMAFFNKAAPTVQCTYQCYLKDIEKVVDEHLTFCEHSDLHFGCKVVRGAYLQSERKRAKLLNIPSPVCDTWEDTNHSYNGVIAKLLKEVSASEKRHLLVATHNEESIQLAMQEFDNLRLDRSSSQVGFAQLYGLSDHLSATLADSGFKVYKSSPIGSVEETIPYMIRRARENDSIIQKSRGERDLIVREILSRFNPFK